MTAGVQWLFFLFFHAEHNSIDGCMFTRVQAPCLVCDILQHKVCFKYVILMTYYFLTSLYWLLDSRVARTAGTARERLR